MTHHRFATALPILVVLLFCGHTASGFEGEFKVPCTIAYNGFPPIETNCMVRSRIIQELTLDIVETPNGKAFILENDKADTSKWYLNHQVAVKTSDEPEPCYRNNEVQICF
jgi:hypothetical protein